MESLSLLSESDGLLTDLAGFSPKISSEIDSLVDHYSDPHYKLMHRILEHPDDLLPEELCPSLLAMLHTLSANSYTKKMSSETRNLKDSDKGVSTNKGAVVGQILV